MNENEHTPQQSKRSPHQDGQHPDRPVLGLDKHLPQAVEEGGDPEEPLEQGGQHHRAHDGGVDDLRHNSVSNLSSLPLDSGLLTSLTGHVSSVSAAMLETGSREGEAAQAMSSAPLRQRRQDERGPPDVYPETAAKRRRPAPARALRGCPARLAAVGGRAHKRTVGYLQLRRCPPDFQARGRGTPALRIRDRPADWGQLEVGRIFLCAQQTG